MSQALVLVSAFSEIWVAFLNMNTLSPSGAFPLLSLMRLDFEVGCEVERPSKTSLGVRVQTSFNSVGSYR